MRQDHRFAVHRSGFGTKTAYDAITDVVGVGCCFGYLRHGLCSVGFDHPRCDGRAFMAGVLDHSNARPAGVSIQASKTVLASDH